MADPGTGPLSLGGSPMVRRPLGRTGLTIAPIALGTTKIGRNTDVKYPVNFSLPSDQAVAELFAAALQLGVNLIDTAPAYGTAEMRLGKLLESHRAEVLICTQDAEQYANCQPPYDFATAAVRASVDASLLRLRTDHIDILLLHSDGRDSEIITQTDALEELIRLKRSGKINAFGLSAKTPAGVRQAARDCDIVMAPFSQ